MFTGLIEEVGTILEISETTEGKRFKIQATKIIGECDIKDSIATNGVCLTVIEKDSNSFSVDVVWTTLKKSSLGALRINDKVNLELALKANARLGGHFVQGHVNTTALIKEINTTGQNWNISFDLKDDLSRYIIDEGSICIDGISLTVAAKHKNGFQVTIIPHTLKNTNLEQRKVGDLVNIEVDLLAKYIENFYLQGRKEDNSNVF